MEDNVFKRLQQETENLAKEKLSKMSDEEINKKANNYKSKLIKTYAICGILSAIIFISFFCCLPLIAEGEPIETGLLVFLIVFAIAITSIFPISLFIDTRKEPKELVLQALKKEMQPEVVNKINQTQVNIIDSSFIVSKTIDIMASGWSSTKLLIDNQNKKFVYQKGKSFSKTYKFSDLINYEVYENGKSQVQGRAGSALIGGAFFGLGGLIVGSSMSRNINEKCNQLKLIIRLNDFNCPQIVITYVDNVDWDKNGWTYRNMKENLQSVCSMLEFMLNEKTLEQSSTVKQEEKTSEQKSQKEQLQELKEMLDDGLITQEDFEQKKKQILGL
jgi:hypothetical protein